MDYATRVSLLGSAVLVVLFLAGTLVYSSLGLFSEEIMNESKQFADEAPSGFGSSVITQTHEFRSGPDGVDMGGVSHVSPNTNIHWRSVAIPDSEGATVASVLQAASDRLQFLQKSPHASNSQAKALWHLEQALNVLEGRTDFTDSILGGEQQ